MVYTAIFGLMKPIVFTLKLFMHRNFSNRFREVDECDQGVLFDGSRTEVWTGACVF